MIARGCPCTLDKGIETLNRLNSHSLLYDEVHLENDKSILFEKSYAVIDDSPALLEKAEQLGKVGTGLVHPWNRESGHPLLVNLNEVYHYIRSGGDTKDIFF